jgi:hypothetical protein
MTIKLPEFPQCHDSSGCTSVIWPKGQLITVHKTQNRCPTPAQYLFSLSKQKASTMLSFFIPTRRLAVLMLMLPVTVAAVVASSEVCAFKCV